MSAALVRRHYALSLLADVRAARAVLPASEALADWLQTYLTQPDSESYEAHLVAVENLRAIDAHLVAFTIPVSVRPELN